MASVESVESADKNIGHEDQDSTQDEKEVEDKCFENELRFVIVGRTGAGISSLGNNLLNKADYFDSKRSAQSVTKISRRGDATRNRRKICVVDTPGLYNTSFSKDHIEKEITKSLGMVAPGPHAVLYVCRVGRHSEEEIQSLKSIIDIFGNDVFKHTVVVFSGKDYLNGEDINQWMQSLPSPFGSFIQKCNGRYILVNSKAYGQEGDEQWKELLSIMESMISKNKLPFFSNNESQTRTWFRTLKRRACQEKKSHNEDTRFGTEDAIRIVLIGRTGNGKSATGNSIVKQKDCFKSSLSFNSVTEVCKRGEVVREGKKVVVVDSPGLFDTTKVSEIIRNEVIKCISVSSPGPHAILYVLSCKTRFTKEEEDTFAEMITMFGEDLYKYIIFIFTAFDEIQGENKTFEDFLNDSKDMFKTLFQKSGNRVLAFNNRVASDDAENERQLQSLFAMITNMNGGNPKLYYQNEMLKNAEQVIEQQMKKIIEEKMKKGEKCDNLEAIRAVVRSQIRDDILREGSMFQSIKQLFFGSKYWYAAGAGAVGVGAVLLRSTQCAIM